MSAVDDRTLTASDVLAAVHELAPSIAARAAEIEAARRLPTDLVDQLIAAGAFRLVLPPSHGGIGADLVSTMRVYEALAAADGSTGWTVMIGGAGWLDLAGLPRATFDAMYARGSDVVVAGALNPTGSIEAVDGGYRVTGRWSFGSGCQHADWIFADCIEGIVDGVPKLRVALLAPDQVIIEDTWYVSGLSGTGSHHFRADGVVVPAERTFDLLNHAPCLDATVVRIPIASAIACCVASVAIGIARGALDDILALAAHKVPLLDHDPLAANPTFHTVLATAETELAAARALVTEVATSLWDTAARGDEPTMAERARSRAAGVWATERAAAVVGAAYRAGGSSSLFTDCALQRRMRDVNAVTQHFVVRPDTLRPAGAILAGNEVDLLVF